MTYKTKSNVHHEQYVRPPRRASGRQHNVEIIARQDAIYERYMAAYNSGAPPPDEFNAAGPSPPQQQQQPQVAQPTPPPPQPPQQQQPQVAQPTPPPPQPPQQQQPQVVQPTPVPQPAPQVIVPPPTPDPADAILGGGAQDKPEAVLGDTQVDMIVAGDSPTSITRISPPTHNYTDADREFARNIIAPPESVIDDIIKHPTIHTGKDAPSGWHKTTGAGGVNHVNVDKNTAKYDTLTYDQKLAIYRKNEGVSTHLEGAKVVYDAFAHERAAEASAAPAVRVDLTPADTILGGGSQNTPEIVLGYASTEPESVPPLQVVAPDTPPIALPTTTTTDTTTPTHGYTDADRTFARNIIAPSESTIDDLIKHSTIHTGRDSPGPGWYVTVNYKGETYSNNVKKNKEKYATLTYDQKLAIYQKNEGVSTHLEGAQTVYDAFAPQRAAEAKEKSDKAAAEKADKAAAEKQKQDDLAAWAGEQDHGPPPTPPPTPTHGYTDTQRSLAEKIIAPTDKQMNAAFAADSWRQINKLPWWNDPEGPYQVNKAKVKARENEIKNMPYDQKLALYHKLPEIEKQHTEGGLQVIYDAFAPQRAYEAEVHARNESIRIAEVSATYRPLAAARINNNVTPQLTEAYYNDVVSHGKMIPKESTPIFERFRDGTYTTADVVQLDAWYLGNVLKFYGDNRKEEFFKFSNMDLSARFALASQHKPIIDADYRKPLTREQLMQKKAKAGKANLGVGGGTSEKLKLAQKGLLSSSKLSAADRAIYRKQHEWRRYVNGEITLLEYTQEHRKIDDKAAPLIKVEKERDKKIKMEGYARDHKQTRQEAAVVNQGWYSDDPHSAGKLNQLKSGAISTAIADQTGRDEGELREAKGSASQIGSGQGLSQEEYDKVIASQRQTAHANLSQQEYTTALAAGEIGIVYSLLNPQTRNTIVRGDNPRDRNLHKALDETYGPGVAQANPEMVSDDFFKAQDNKQMGARRQAQTLGTMGDLRDYANAPHLVSGEEYLKRKANTSAIEGAPKVSIYTPTITRPPPGTDDPLASYTKTENKVLSSGKDQVLLSSIADGTVLIIDDVTGEKRKPTEEELARLRKYGPTGSPPRTGGQARQKTFEESLADGTLMVIDDVTGEKRKPTADELERLKKYGPTGSPPPTHGPIRPKTFEESLADGTLMVIDDVTGEKRKPTESELARLKEFGPTGSPPNANASIAPLGLPTGESVVGEKEKAKTKGGRRGGRNTSFNADGAIDPNTVAYSHENPYATAAADYMFGGGGLGGWKVDYADPNVSDVEKFGHGLATGVSEIATDFGAIGSGLITAAHGGDGFAAMEDFNKKYAPDTAADYFIGEGIRHGSNLVTGSDTPADPRYQKDGNITQSAAGMAGSAVGFGITLLSPVGIIKAISKGGAVAGKVATKLPGVLPSKISNPIVTRAGGVVPDTTSVPKWVDDTAKGYIPPQYDESGKLIPTPGKLEIIPEETTKSGVTYAVKPTDDAVQTNNPTAIHISTDIGDIRKPGKGAKIQVDVMGGGPRPHDPTTPINVKHGDSSIPHNTPQSRTGELVTIEQKGGLGLDTPNVTPVKSLPTGDIKRPGGALSGSDGHFRVDLADKDSFNINTNKIDPATRQGQDVLAGLAKDWKEIGYRDTTTGNIDQIRAGSPAPQQTTYLAPNKPSPPQSLPGAKQPKAKDADVEQILKDRDKPPEEPQNPNKADPNDPDILNIIKEKPKKLDPPREVPPGVPEPPKAQSPGGVLGSSPPKINPLTGKPTSPPRSPPPKTAPEAPPSGGKGTGGLEAPTLIQKQKDDILSGFRPGPKPRPQPPTAKPKPPTVLPGLVVPVVPAPQDTAQVEQSSITGIPTHPPVESHPPLTVSPTVTVPPQQTPITTTQTDTDTAKDRSEITPIVGIRPISGDDDDGSSSNITTAVPPIQSTEQTPLLASITNINTGERSDITPVLVNPFISVQDDDTTSNITTLTPPIQTPKQKPKLNPFVPDTPRDTTDITPIVTTPTIPTQDEDITTLVPPIQVPSETPLLVTTPVQTPDEDQDLKTTWPNPNPPQDDLTTTWPPRLDDPERQILDPWVPPGGGDTDTPLNPFIPSDPTTPLRPGLGTPWGNLDDEQFRPAPKWNYRKNNKRWVGNTFKNTFLGFSKHSEVRYSKTAKEEALDVTMLSGRGSKRVKPQFGNLFASNNFGGGFNPRSRSGFTSAGMSSMLGRRRNPKSL